MTERNLLLLTGALAVPELAVAAADPQSPWRWLTKPLPMIALIGCFAWQRQRKGSKAGLLILVALVLSLIGDLLLINEGRTFFLAGLGAFWVAHVCYTVGFWRQHGPGDTMLAQPVRLGAVFAILGFGLWMLLTVMGRERLGDLFTPVALYVGVIMAMSISALHRLNGVELMSFRLVTAGALLFLLSDSLLAYSLFVSAFPMATVVIMATYYAAQALITTGYARSL